MTDKRFKCVFKEHETKNSWSMIKDNQLDKPLYIKDVVDLLNELSEENKYLKKRIKVISDELYCKEKVDEQQVIIDKQELRLQHLEELLELSENLNKSYREKLIDMNLKMVMDDE